MVNEELKAVKKLKDEKNPNALVEYYLTNEGNNKFGFKVSKKTNISEGQITCCEEHTLEYTVGERTTADRLIELLSKNTVTPVTVENVLHDLGYVL